MSLRRFKTGEGTFAVWIGVLSVLAGLMGPVALWAQDQRASNAAPVRVAPVVRQEVRPYVRLIGTSRAFRHSLVASEVEGRVVAFEARRGEKVDRNGLLARIDPKVFRLQLKEARAQLREAEANHERAKLELQRIRTLYEGKSVSSREYDDVRFQAGALESRIRALEARIESILHDVNRCTVRAPFAGFVVEEHAEVGQWVREGGGVAEVADIDPILVTIPVPDRYVRFVGSGQAISLVFDGLGEDGEREGTVRSVVPAGNEQARTFPVEVLVPNPEGELLAGFSCVARIPVGGETPRLLVPKDALVPGEADAYHVFLVRDGKAEQVAVERGQAHGERVVVKGALDADEPVVVEGNERLRPGQPVVVDQP